MWRKNAILGGVKVGSHFIIDRSGVIYPLIDPNFVASHAPSQNKRGIGVDLQYDHTGSEAEIFFLDAQYKSLAALIQYLSTRFPNIKADDYHVMGHGECQANRVDPHNFNFEKLNELIPGAAFSNSKHNRLYTSKEMKGTSHPTDFTSVCEYIRIGKQTYKQ